MPRRCPHPTSFIASIRELLPVLGLVFLAAAGPSVGNAQDRYYVEPVELKRYINMGDIDRLRELFNFVKGMRYKGEILPFVRDLWDEREDKHPNIRWDVAKKPIVKLELADILAQAERNGLIEIDKQSIRQFASKYLSAEDVEVLARAVFVLGLIDDERDVPKILAIAKLEGQSTFRTAVFALADMCNEAASRALDELEPQLKREEFRAYVVDMRKRQLVYHDDFCRDRARAIRQ